MKLRRLAHPLPADFSYARHTAVYNEDYRALLRVLRAAAKFVDAATLTGEPDTFTPLVNAVRAFEVTR